MEKAIKVIADILGHSSNEGTSAPFWLIIDPTQNMSCDPHVVGFNLEGPFFCRQDGEDYLKAHRYNFGDRAVVYCCSGCHSKKYYNLCKTMGKV